LAVLDARDLVSRAQQMRETLKAAQAQRDLAKSELARVEELLKRNVTTRQRHDQVVSALRVAEAEVDRLRQSLAEAETALSYTEIRAPGAGRVIDRLAEPGDVAAPGQPLLRLYDPAALRVEAPVRESLAVNLTVGQTLRVEIPALQETVEGPIDEIVPFSDPGARTLLVKVAIPADPRLLAGMFARAAIPAGERERILVPATAVTRIGQLEFVTVVGEDGVARRLVTTGNSTGDGRIEVLSGLRAGERVVAVNR
jgi:RND family efflux transporter MFP subunit